MPPLPCPLHSLIAHTTTPHAPPIKRRCLPATRWCRHPHARWHSHKPLSQPTTLPPQTVKRGRVFCCQANVPTVTAWPGVCGGDSWPSPANVWCGCWVSRVRTGLLLILLMFGVPVSLTSTAHPTASPCWVQKGPFEERSDASKQFQMTEVYPPPLLSLLSRFLSLSPLHPSVVIPRPLRSLPVVRWDGMVRA